VKTLRETILKHSWQEDMVGPHLVRVDDAIDALRQWLADEWLVVVPGEATIAMTHAVWTTDLPRPDMHGDYSDLDVQMAARDIWRSMIAAAPDALKAPDPAP
jgi:hypothetical protein